MNEIRILKYKFWIKYLLSGLKNSELNIYKKKRKCIVCLAADYGNLGDVAITYAQANFLKKNLKGYEIIDFPISKTLSELKILKKICTPEDIITIVGGGNMGDMYYDIELLRLLIIHTFKKNKIISFPQTIDYTDTNNSNYLKKLSNKIYSSHPNLLLCAREVNSYKVMQNLYPTVPVRLVPDIVMSLDKRIPNTERKGITFAMRKDQEKGNMGFLSSQLKITLDRKGTTITDYDTHIGKEHMSVSERELELEKIFKQFSNSEWVITDRLHGMIFAFITQTPAIVFPNSNFKVAKCYEWIKECGYIYFVEGMSLQQIIEIITQKNIKYNFDSVHKNINNRLQEILK